MELLTPRLRLRPWTDADRDGFAAMSLHPDITRYLSSIANRADADAWVDRQMARQAEDGFCFWAVEERGSETLVGSVGISRIRYEAHFTPAVELGWRIGRPYWGAGYAPEAAAESLRHGFAALTVPELVAVTVPANTRSQRVMAKLGMTRDRDGDFDHPMMPDGHPLRHHVLHRITRDAWMAREAAGGTVGREQVAQPAPEVHNGSGARP